MLDQQGELPVGPEATMSGAAAKLLLYQLAHPGEPATIAEIMRGAGIGSRTTYYAAKHELEVLDGHAKGWRDRYTFRYTIPETVLPIPESVLPIPETVLPGGVSRPFIRALPLEAEVITPAPTVIPIESNWRERVMQADLLPGGGVEHQRTSEFQARRRVQVQVLQGAWSELFKQQLTADSAKDLLSLTDNFAEDVLDAMETAKARGVQSPRGYLIKMLQNKRSQVKPQTVRSANIGAPSKSDDDASSDDNYYLTKPTPHTARVTAILKAKGLLEDDEDDD